MDAGRIIEQILDAAVSYAEAPGAPPRLAEAIRYSVFPGGQRIRPKLCLAVANACGNSDPFAAAAAAAAIELLHCASLVHDDLPCFDDAETRRGKASVHRAFGEPLAVLAGDALIVLAFETLGRGTTRSPERLPQLLMTIARAVGSPHGITAGQAWECEPRIILEDYQQAKTGALFSAATVAGAAAAGMDGAPWRILGEKLGAAYQVADDLRDVAGNPDDIGKPVGRDAVLGRPNAAHELGVQGAVMHLKRLVTDAVDSIPNCPGAADLRIQMYAETLKFLPKELARVAA
jgi:geranylgeranyl diphosphate synthase, type II